MFTIRIYFISLAILVCSCSTKNDTDIQQMVFEITNYVELDKRFLERTEVISLKQISADFFLSDEIQLIEKTDGYFIFDEINKQVVKYSLNGDFATLVGRRGNGPGEYSSPVGIFDRVEGIAVYDKDQQKIHHFDDSGAYLDSSPIADLNYIEKIISFDDGFVVSRFIDRGLYNTREKNQRILIWDEKYQTVYSYHPIDIVDDPFSPKTQLSPSIDGINYLRHFDNTSYLIKEESMSPRFSFDFGAYQLPSNFDHTKLSEALQLFSMLSSKDYAFCTAMFENDQFVLFEILLSKSQTSQYHLYSKAKNQIIHAFASSYGRFIGASKDGAFIMLVTGKVDLPPAILEQQGIRVSHQAGSRLVKYYFQNESENR